MSHWRKQQDTGWAKTNKKDAHETEQQGPQFNPDEGHEGRIHEVLQEDGRSSMYRIMITQLRCKKENCHALFVVCRL